MIAEMEDSQQPFETQTALSVSEFRRELTAAIPHMRAFAQSLTGDPTRADDLTQDALVKAWSAKERFQAGTNFRAWVFTIVRNLFYSERRRAWRQVAWDQEHAERTIKAADDQESIIALDELRRALQELPDDQREALILVGAGGFAYDEVAEICGCAVGTVKSRVSRARGALEGILAKGPALKADEDGVSASDAIDSLLESVDTLVEQPSG